MNPYVKHISLSFVGKGLSVLSSLMIVPLTIRFIDSTRYGIWMALTSVVAWISFFDFGLGNGFRNRFAQAKANDNLNLAKQYVSTTYFALACIFFAFTLLALCANNFIDWTIILNVDPSYCSELRPVFGIVCSFFSLSMVTNLFTTMLTADQKPGYAAIVTGFSQFVSLAALWILTRSCEGSLLKLALYFSGVPCFTVIIISFIAFISGPYKIFRPSIRDVNIKLVPSILSLGTSFFVISLCLLVLFQMMNIIISRNLGPQAVTEYNIAYKYFNVLYIVALTVITPFWSSFTEAYESKKFVWMMSICRKLEFFWLASVVAAVVMLILSPFVYKFWIGGNIEVDFATSLALLIYVLSQILGNIYMYMINGIGTVRIQLLVYVCFAIIAWPLMNMFCRLWGAMGVVIVPSTVCIVQAVFGKIQLTKIIKGSASGLWLK